GERAHAGADGVARLPRHALADGDADVERAAARRGGIDGDRFALGRLKGVPDADLGSQRRKLRGVGPAERLAADRRGLEQRVVAVRDGGDVEHWIAFDGAVIAEEFAVRPLRLAMALLVDIVIDVIL